MMRRLIILSLTISGACLPVYSQQGFGADVPTNVVCTASTTDSSLATCTFNTTQSSDSEIWFIDGLSNSTTMWYNPTMTTTHTVQLNHLAENTTWTYFAAACTHTVFTTAGTACPLNSPDMSSNGPSRLMPSGASFRPTFKTIANPSSATLSSWFSYVQAPQNIFPGQVVFIDTQQGFGVGAVASAAGTIPAGGVVYILLHDVTIDTPSSGTWQCGVQTGTNGIPAHTPQYWQLGAKPPGVINCRGTSVAASNDFTIALEGQNTWIANSNQLGLSLTYNSPIKSSTNSGYTMALSSWVRAVSRIVVIPGSNIPPGTYTVHYHLQPLFNDGTGNETGGALVSLDHQHDVTFNVLATTPIAINPPGTFTWSFLPVHLAMASWWGTWVCSNPLDNRQAKGPWAMNNISGVYNNVWWTANTWNQNWAHNYDTQRQQLAIGDWLFSSTHPPWAASHTYTFGDVITQSGTTYIMQAVSGKAAIGMIGVSGPGPSPPNFNTTPGAATTDGPLEWLSVGTPTYWQGCAIRGGDGFRNNILLNQGNNGQEFTNFATGIMMHFWRTGDTSAGAATSSSTPSTIYTETNGRFGGYTGLKSVANSCLASTDPTLVETGTNTYWTGGDRLAVCYMSSVNSYADTNLNDNYIGGVRTKSLYTNSQTARWLTTNNPSWINTDEGLRLKREIDTVMSLVDMFLTISPQNLVPPALGINSIIPMYQFGQATETLLHYYLATVYFSNTTLFPGTTVTPDERIPIALKRAADGAWLQLFDRVYDKNESAADSCYPQYYMCQNTRRIHSYSFPYNPWGLSDKWIDFEFFNVAGSNGEIAWLYSWLYARNSTMVIPNNGRNSPVITSYRDAADLIQRHAWDGYICPLVTATAPGNCTAWNVADYWHGGSTLVSGGGIQPGVNYQISGSKEVNQLSVNSNSEGLHWLLGDWTWQQDAMEQMTNPCWITANRNADGTCNKPSPYADVQQPYPIMFGKNGSNPANPEPQICTPGTAINTTLSGCRLSQALGTNQVPLNQAITPGTLTGNSAVFNFLTVKNATCWVVVDTPVAEPASPTVGINRFNEQPSHTPTIAGGTPLPLWFHSITATGLKVSTIYHFGLYCQDNQTPPNVYNFPYQTGGSTGKIAIAFGTQNQARTFTTLSSGLQLATTALPDGIQTSPYSATLGGSGGTPPYSWSIVGGVLPTGLTLNSSSGVISGNPTGSGTSSFTVTLTDSTSASTSSTLSILVQPTPLVLAVSNSNFPDGQVGVGYSQTLIGVGGSPPYTWSSTPSNIGGLTVDPNTGILSGVPSVAGAFPFTITITDSLSATANSPTYTINIAPNQVGIQVGKKAAMKGASVQ